MEITSEEQSKKSEKNWGWSQRCLGQYQMHQHSNYSGPRRRREKERVWENFWSDYNLKFPHRGKGNSQSSPKGTKSPMQDKPKKEHAKTHTNQTNKD